MKRVIEQRNLAFNHIVNICDLCKRCKGFWSKDDDLYDCKYNKDKKGLYNGTVEGHMNVFKCKYYKRNSKYHTCRLQGKIRGIYKNGSIAKHIRYKQGKFVIVGRKE